MDTATALAALNNLGLSPTAASIYIDLTTSGISTVVEISDRTDIPRTSVYRALAELQTHQLVRFDGQNRTHYRAQGYHNLESLVRKQEKHVSELADSLPELFGFFLNLAGSQSDATSVRYYEGQEGLDKAMINTLDTKGIYRIYEMKQLHNVVDMDLAEYIRSEMIRRKQISHQITNIRKHNDVTNVNGFVNKHWEMRFIEKRLLPIDVEIAIYNDIVAIYDYGKNMFCIEIANEQLARMQRGIFDYIWKTARKMRFVNEHGAAVLDA
jgi:sugar-specific transcriptional regulator TrmB